MKKLMVVLCVSIVIGLVILASKTNKSESDANTVAHAQSAPESIETFVPSEQETETHTEKSVTVTATGFKVTIDEN